MYQRPWWVSGEIHQVWWYPLMPDISGLQLVVGLMWWFTGELDGWTGVIGGLGRGVGWSSVWVSGIIFILKGSECMGFVTISYEQLFRIRWRVVNSIWDLTSKWWCWRAIWLPMGLLLLAHPHRHSGCGWHRAVADVLGNDSGCCCEIWVGGQRRKKRGDDLNGDDSGIGGCCGQ